MNRWYFFQLAISVYDKLTANGAKSIAETRDQTPLFAFTNTIDAKILRAAQLGIINGYADGSFKPNATLSREKAATMIYRLSNCFEKGENTVAAIAFKRSKTNCQLCERRSTICFISLRSSNAKLYYARQ